MGCGASGEFKPKESKESKEISEKLAQEEKALKNEVKLLLLGAGESGKSTVAKQMKLIYQQGFSEEEKKRIYIGGSKQYIGIYATIDWRCRTSWNQH